MYSIGDTYLRLFVTTGIAAIFYDIPTLHTGNTATFPVLMHMSLAAGALNLTCIWICSLFSKETKSNIPLMYPSNIVVVKKMH